LIEHRDLLIFRSSGLGCAFPLEAVREIVPMARLACPPGLPSALAGFLDLRGAAIPILRLDRLFDLPEQRPGLHTPMIVLRGITAPIGVLVDSVRGIVATPPAGLLAIPGDCTFQGCATGTMELDGDLIHVLSAAALLADKEHRMIADYSAMSLARLAHLAGRT
jgi:purine-binding chemotaxis protein CheW